jgi:hypothetical protein
MFRVHLYLVTLKSAVCSSDWFPAASTKAPAGTVTLTVPLRPANGASFRSSPRHTQLPVHDIAQLPACTTAVIGLKPITVTLDVVGGDEGFPVTVTVTFATSSFTHAVAAAGSASGSVPGLGAATNVTTGGVASHCTVCLAVCPATTDAGQPATNTFAPSGPLNVTIDAYVAGLTPIPDVCVSIADTPPSSCATGTIPGSGVPASASILTCAL